MPKFDVVFYDMHDERVSEAEYEGADVAEALIAASNILARTQGKAHVTSVLVEEILEPQQDQE